MPYTADNPPKWTKNMPKAAQALAVRIFNEVFEDTGDEEGARIAAISAVKSKFVKSDDEWKAKQAVSSNMIQFLSEKAKQQPRDELGHFKKGHMTDAGVKNVKKNQFKSPGSNIAVLTAKEKGLKPKPAENRKDKAINNVKDYGMSLPIGIRKEFKNKTGDKPKKNKIKSTILGLLKKYGIQSIPKQKRPEFLNIRERVMGEGKSQQTADSAAADKIADDLSSGSMVISARMGCRAVQASGDKTGKKWEAVLIEPGISKSNPPFFWSEDFLRQNLHAFQNIPVNFYEMPGHYLSHLPDMGAFPVENLKNYMISNNAGRVEKVWFDENRGVCGIINFHSAEQGRKLAQHELSIDSRIKGYDGTVDGIACKIPTQLKGISSIDVVIRAAAGGAFQRAVAGMQKEEVMKKKFLELIKKKRPELLEGKNVDKITELEAEMLAQQAIMEKTEEKPEKKKPETTGMTSDQFELAMTRVLQAVPKQGTVIDMNAIMETIKQTAETALNPDLIESRIKAVTDTLESRAACGRYLDNSLAESLLPEPVRKRIKTTFDGDVFEFEKLDATIKEEKELMAQLAVPGFSIPDMNRGNDVGIGPVEKNEIALAKAFGLEKEDIIVAKQARRLDGERIFEELRAGMSVSDSYIRSGQSMIDAYDDIAPFAGLGQAYTAFSGDPTVSGKFRPENLSYDLRASQDVVSTTWANALSNIMYRRLLKDYRQISFQEELLISTEKNITDLRPQEAIMVGYFGDIATVTEGNAYLEITPFTDEKISYSLYKIGGKVTVTIETILRDDLQVLVRMIRNLAKAARRTYAKQIWSHFISNTNCTDGTAWFTAPHGNLGSTALGYATANAAYIALSKMTEKDSGELVGLTEDPENMPVLVYPVDLAVTADTIVNQEKYFTGADMSTETKNFLKGRIKGRQISLFTDVNDWGMLLNPKVVDMVEVGFLRGAKEPEFFLAENPTVGAMFSNDQTVHKLRWWFGSTALDFRSGYKAVVT